LLNPLDYVPFHSAIDRGNLADTLKNDEQVLKLNTVLSELISLERVLHGFYGWLFVAYHSLDERAHIYHFFIPMTKAVLSVR
jgi:hypothetical protein